MAEDTTDEAAAADEMAAEPGKPASQVEAEHPSEEVQEQEARELASRMPGLLSRDEGGDESEAEEDPADEAPAEEAPAEG